MPKKYCVGNVKEEYEHLYLPGIHSLKSFSEIKGPIQKIFLKRDSCSSLYTAGRG